MCTGLLRPGVVDNGGMTKTLQTLIKLSRQELDAYRRDLNVYLGKKDELIEKKRILHESLLREAELFAQMPDTQYAYSNYAINVGVQQENLDKFMLVIDGQINALQDKIAEAFQTMKRYEILKDIKEKEAVKEEARKEVIELDEMGMNSFLRKEE